MIRNETLRVSNKSKVSQPSGPTINDDSVLQAQSHSESMRVLSSQAQNPPEHFNQDLNDPNIPPLLTQSELARRTMNIIPPIALHSLKVNQISMQPTEQDFNKKGKNKNKNVNQSNLMNL